MRHTGARRVEESGCSGKASVQTKRGVEGGAFEAFF